MMTDIHIIFLDFVYFNRNTNILNRNGTKHGHPKERSTQVKDEVIGGFGWVMVFTATFNNISVISWRSVLLVEEIGVPEENHRPAASH